MKRQKVKKEAEAIAWIKKYFKAHSLERIFLLFPIKGMKEIIFNSNPIHAPNQFVAEIEIKEEEKIIRENKIFKLLKINKVYSSLLHYSV